MPSKWFDPFVRELHEGISLRDDRAWLEAMMDEGRKVIDIGPDFKLRPTRGPSPYYGIERQALRERRYLNHEKVFERSGRWTGGVPGLDLP